MFYVFLCPWAFLTAMMAPSCQGSKYQYLEETQVDGSGPMASKTDVKQAAWDPIGLLGGKQLANDSVYMARQTGTSLKVYNTKRGIIIFESIILTLRKCLVESKFQTPCIHRQMWHQGWKSTPRHPTKSWLNLQGFIPNFNWFPASKGNQNPSRKPIQNQKSKVLNQRFGGKLESNHTRRMACLSNTCRVGKFDSWPCKTRVDGQPVKMN